MIQIFEINFDNYTKTKDEKQWFLSMTHIADNENDLKSICDIFSLYIQDIFSVCVDLNLEDFKSIYKYKTKQKLVFNYSESKVSLSLMTYNFNQN